MLEHVSGYPGKIVGLEIYVSVLVDLFTKFPSVQMQLPLFTTGEVSCSQCILFLYVPSCCIHCFNAKFSTIETSLR